nr:glycerate kinase [Baekduia soli]
MAHRVLGAAAPTILLAPDSFKGTFTAREVAEALAAGVRAAGARPDRCPVADGGEGTMDVLLAGWAAPSPTPTSTTRSAAP